MPLQATSGAASYDAFGGGVAAVPNYIEDVFSTYLIKPSADYTTYSINNGIDLSTKGGMTWFKARDAAQNNLVYDTARGSSSGSPNALITNSTAAQQTAYFDYVTPNTNGFTVNYLSGGGQLTNSGINYASWTFRKAPKFFDVVTYTGSSSTQVINHSLGAEVGFMVIKRVSSGTGQWYAYHRSLTSGYLLKLSSTDAAANVASSLFYNVTSTSFTVDAGAYHTNAAGETYVAYLFAHDAGGFGLTGTDNVISCGSVITDGSGNASVTLGYEPQWLLFKSSSSAEDWYLVDNMRGFTVAGQPDPLLFPNTSGAENSGASLCQPTATGFGFTNSALTANATYIYIAIRRGPMKVPTSGTSVFVPAIGNNSTSAGGEIFTTNFPVDFFMRKVRATTDFAPFAYSRLTAGKYLVTGTTAAEATDTSTWFDTNTGIDYQYASNFSGQIGWLFQRAPSFFDEVCYTGTGTTTQQCSHNLGVQPELIIVRKRSAVQAWKVASTKMPNPYSSTNPWWDELYLNTTAAVNQGLGYIDNLATTTFTVAGATVLNQSGTTYVAYLFATCAGVSKVGNYTGTGTTKQIDCGFTGGARFVLIKRTDSTGDWYVWDTARGIVSGNDPYLLLNSTAAEVTSTDYIDTYSAGFEISSSAPSAINASGGTFIFLAIA